MTLWLCHYSSKTLLK